MVMMWLVLHSANCCVFCYWYRMKYCPTDECENVDMLGTVSWLIQVSYLELSFLSSKSTFMCFVIFLFSKCSDQIPVYFLVIFNYRYVSDLWINLYYDIIYSYSSRFLAQFLEKFFGFCLQTFYLFIYLWHWISVF